MTNRWKVDETYSTMGLGSGVGCCSSSSSVVVAVLDAFVRARVRRSPPENCHGRELGSLDGSIDGPPLGTDDGCADGSIEGLPDGPSDGIGVASDEGRLDGIADTVGEDDGFAVL